MYDTVIGSLPCRVTGVENKKELTDYRTTEDMCSRRADHNYPSPRGEECRKCQKYGPTLFVLLGMIIIIWLPFLIFAFFDTVAQPNLPQKAGLTIELGNFGRLFRTSVTLNDIVTITPTQFEKMQTLYQNNRKIYSFLSLFDSRDVAVLRFRYSSHEPWILTPPDVELFRKIFHNIDIPIYLYLSWQIERIPRSLIVDTSKGFTTLDMNHDEGRSAFKSVLTNPNMKVRLNRILPKFIHVTNEGEAKPVPGFMFYTLRNAELSFINATTISWWEVKELNDDPDEGILATLPYYSSNEIIIYTFNDKNIPKLLLNVSKKGDRSLGQVRPKRHLLHLQVLSFLSIIGLYISIVLVLWTIARRLMWKYPQIMFDDMPNPDPVLRLCRDIYLARESREFALEEDLFAKLLFLFRSPETMSKFTRLKHQNPTKNA